MAKRISEVKEIYTEEEANKMLEEGWEYLNVNTSAHPTSYILCKTTEYEPI